MSMVLILAVAFGAAVIGGAILYFSFRSGDGDDRGE
jgi:nitrogen fixation-related uncharacterized protein